MTRNPWAMARRRAFVRGSLAAVVSTALALICHLMAGGPLPALPGLVLPLFLATGSCILLAGVRLPATRLLLSAGASQVLFHNLFMLGATDLGGAASHAPHAMSTPAHEAHSSGWMVLAHLAAAVCTALALRHGELVVARLCATVRRVARPLLRPIIPPPARPTTPPAPLADERAWEPTTRLLVRTSVVRRGPPTALAVPTS